MLFQAIPSYSARRSLFEHYVKTRAEEERKEKRAAQRAAIEGFKQLLDEASEVLFCIQSNLIYSCYGFFIKTLALKLELKNADIYFIFRISITTLIIKHSERNGEMIRGLRHWIARIESSCLMKGVAEPYTFDLSYL